MPSSADPSPDRIASLDRLRGVAVMGILAMNIVGFAMPEAAYLNPSAYGLDDSADLVAWAAGFIFVDGKMRGLFSLLFGASMLIVLDRAEAAGANAEREHFRRMGWLVVFGLLHLYLVWHGDILSLYAPVGALAWFLHMRAMPSLLRTAATLILIQFLIFALYAGILLHAEAAAAAPGASAESLRNLESMNAGFAAPDAKALAAELAVFRGSYGGIFLYRLQAFGGLPIISLLSFGWETLAYMLLGMVGLRSGFLTGGWTMRAYAKVAAAGFAVAVPLYALFAWLIWRSGFAPGSIAAWALAAPILVRPVMIVAFAALILLILLDGGRLTLWIEAAGRAAFTNYLGSSLAMTGLFYGYGLGLYGAFGRAELWLFVLGGWAAMLLWSKPWLDRYRYGPFEWLWRSLARGRAQPMRKA